MTAVSGKATRCFNLSPRTSLPVCLLASATVKVTDCLGNVLSASPLPSGVHLIDVPLCGTVEIL